MTTLLHKTNAYKKAQAISSGFLEMTFMLTPLQGLAKFRSVIKHHIEDNSITFCDIVLFRADKATSVWLLQYKRMGGM